MTIYLHSKSTAKDGICLDPRVLLHFRKVYSHYADLGQYIITTQKKYVNLLYLYAELKQYTNSPHKISSAPNHTPKTKKISNF